MRARSVLAVIAAIALVAAPAAGAATQKKPPAKKPPAKTYCNLLVDPAGDGNVGPISSKGMDIIGGDLATGKKSMVAVLRLSDTNFSASHDPYALLEYAWTFTAESSIGQSYSFSAKWNGNNLSNPLSYGAQVGTDGVAVKSFTIDTTHNTFTWVLDRSVDKMLTHKNIVFKHFHAQSNLFGSQSADSAPNNAATMTSTYPDQAPSCVHAS